MTYSPTHIQIQALHTNPNKEPTADLFVAAELRGVEQRAVVEQLRDELGSAHPGVAVRVGDQSGQSCDHQHLDDRVVTETSRFTFQRDRN